MEPNPFQNTQNSINFQNNINSQTQEQEIPVFERPFEEVEGGFYDDRGFYTTPNGSFWDDDNNYFNHFGLDVHGGTYDKYGIYQPGKDFDEKTGFYNNEKIINLNEEEAFKTVKNCIYNLEQQYKKDDKVVKKFAKPEESEDSDEDDNDKSNITFDENDLKEAMDLVMENENHDDNIMKKNNNNIIDLDMNGM